MQPLWSNIAAYLGHIAPIRMVGIRLARGGQFPKCSWHCQRTKTVRSLERPSYKNNEMEFRYHAGFSHTNHLMPHSVLAQI